MGEETEKMGEVGETKRGRETFAQYMCMCLSGPGVHHVPSTKE